MSLEPLKKAAAEKAVEQVESGMIVGLGTGSTTKYAVIKIGQLWQAGHLTDIIGIPTSEGTAALARQYGLSLGTLDDYPLLDLVIDGADEVDPAMNLVKGLGAALLREKMIEMSTRHFVVVVDESKCVDKLGTRAPLSVEVIQFGWRHQARWLTDSFNCTPVLRGGEAEPLITDNSNYILDCTFPNGIDDPPGLAVALKARTGIVEHGIFFGMADEVIIAGSEGLRFMP